MFPVPSDCLIAFSLCASPSLVSPVSQPPGVCIYSPAFPFVKSFVSLSVDVSLCFSSASHLCLVLTLTQPCSSFLILYIFIKVLLLPGLSFFPFAHFVLTSMILRIHCNSLMTFRHEAASWRRFNIFLLPSLAP